MSSNDCQQGRVPVPIKQPASKKSISVNNSRCDPQVKFSAEMEKMLIL